MEARRQGSKEERSIVDLAESRAPQMMRLPGEGKQNKRAGSAFAAEGDVGGVTSAVSIYSH